MVAPPISMTGFGRGEADLGAGSVIAEVKSVNSRHLEVRVRLPRELAGLEPGLREIASAHFQRGQVEVTVRLPGEGLPGAVVEIDLEAAGRYADAARDMRDRLGLHDDLDVASLISLPGVARLRDRELDPEATEQALRAAVEKACLAAAAMRAREGRALGAELERRLDALEHPIASIETRADEVRASLRERLDKRLAALAPEFELDAGRLEQEVLLYADRMDVTEEIVRLRSHLEQFRETLAQDGSIGRKLEFLLQELGREVNTIGSKAQDVPVTRCVVELKTELEKLREQVLNIE